MTDRFGTFEHAEGTSPRLENGYCTDDMARLLMVTSRVTDRGPLSALSAGLADKALRFVVEAQSANGATCNRRDRHGRWSGGDSTEDCWGRSLWGLGTAAARSQSASVRALALAHFDRGAQQRSPWPRAMAFSALGAAEVLAAYPAHQGALGLLEDAIDVVGCGGQTVRGPWPWPEPRLSYANAVIPDSLIAAGAALGRPDVVGAGLVLLAWLLEHETAGGHLSVTPVGGAGPGDKTPAFDQQPIEVAALADACARASRLTGYRRWDAGVALAVAWFLGDNDARCPMWDSDSGGGYDGLQADGPNLNQGAESTIALVSTLQHGRRLDGLRR